MWSCKEDEENELKIFEGEKIKKYEV